MVDHALRELGPGETFEHLPPVGRVPTAVAHEVQGDQLLREVGHGVEDIDDPFADQPVADAQQRHRAPPTQVERARALVRREHPALAGRPPAWPAAARPPSSWSARCGLARPAGSPAARPGGRTGAARPGAAGAVSTPPRSWCTLPTSGVRRPAPRASQGPSVFEARLSTTTTSAPAVALRMTDGPSTTASGNGRVGTETKRTVAPLSPARSATRR